MATRLRTLSGFGVILVAVMSLTALVVFREGSADTQAGQPASSKKTSQADPLVKVRVGHPTVGGYQRTTEQPGLVAAFEKADLYAQVSGILKTQSVDIGDEVHEGQVLAEIDAPERLREMEHAEALLKQAQSTVELMTARVSKAEADLEALKIDVGTSEANLERAESLLSLRQKQYERLKSLLELKSIDERVVDEKLDQQEAAASDVHASKVAIETSKAKVRSAAAGVAEANANLVEARAEVDVAQAQLAKTKVYVAYTKIVSPYNGIVTQRNFDRGDFIRDASSGGQIPMLSVARRDLMRVVIQIPNSDVPHTHVGNQASVVIQTLPGKTFDGQVSRIARSEDRRNLTMRAEVDLKNDENLLLDGMYGKVLIHFDSAKSALAIPTSSLVSTSADEQGVYVVHDGKAHLTPLHLGDSDGIHTEVLSGLDADDLLVLSPGQELSDGTAVAPIEATRQSGSEHSQAKSSGTGQ
ncbi:MAG: efflux RND transporter periplasmic adaptor subunit [Planctomycetes bacterium]|nr:efflux RND transporter periplasmic adaptor subunit [Planctomycetota bacterium]